MDEVEELARKGLYLPSRLGVKEEEIKFIYEAIKEIKELVK